MKKRAGIVLTEQEERRLERFNESVSMKEIPKNRKGIVPQKPQPEPYEDEVEDMIDLDEILREMGYGEEDGTEMTTYLMKDLYDEVNDECDLDEV